MIGRDWMDGSLLFLKLSVVITNSGLRLAASLYVLWIFVTLWILNAKSVYTALTRDFMHTLLLRSHRCYESQRCKCFQYWPRVEGQSLRFTAVSSSSNTLVTPGTDWGGGSPSGTIASSKKKPHPGRPRRSASEVSNSSKFVFEVTHVASHPGDDYTRTKLRLKEVKVSLSFHLALCWFNFYLSTALYSRARVGLSTTTPFILGLITGSHRTALPCWSCLTPCRLNTPQPSIANWATPTLTTPLSLPLPLWSTAALASGGQVSFYAFYLLHLSRCD